mmetsp:Transcript_736/g.1350  ORF Transcript_736/g.1350 Transcript_736/m.1350 type:complete len:215 (-) Transcript_736:270-914(-)
MPLIPALLNGWKAELPLSLIHLIRNLVMHWANTFSVSVREDAESWCCFQLNPAHSFIHCYCCPTTDSKYSSFQRQLNQYGWCKLRNTGKFFNQYFHQDREQSSFDLITRKDKDKKTDGSLASRGRVTKRVSVESSSGQSGLDSKKGIEYISVPPTKKRRRMSSISEPRLQPVSDEETISSEEGSILARPMSFVDLTRPPSNVTAYLPHSHHHHH